MEVFEKAELSRFIEAFQVALMVKNPPANAGDTKRHGLDPQLGKISWKRMATQSRILFFFFQSRILACEISWTEESGKLQSIGLQRFGHD